MLACAMQPDLATLPKSILNPQSAYLDTPAYLFLTPCIPARTSLPGASASYKGFLGRVSDLEHGQPLGETLRALTLRVLQVYHPALKCIYYL